MTPTELTSAMDRLGLHYRHGAVQLAQMLGVSPSTVRRWLAGSQPIPKVVALAVRFLLVSL